jgi:hypothetical protein
MVTLHSLAYQFLSRLGAQFFILVVFLGLRLLNCPEMANAWWPEPHKDIGRNALGVLPDGLRKILESDSENLSALLWGIVEPDYNRVEDHRIYLRVIRGTKEGPGGVHAALEKYAQRAEEMIKAGEPVNRVAFVLGQAAHFIMDANVPLHTIYGDTTEQHRAYEGVAFFPSWPGNQYGYRGFRLVKDYRCFAYDAAKRSHKYYAQALQTPPPLEVIEKTWDDAVNDTANLWMSIFCRALGPEKSLRLYGIPAPKEEVGKGWFCW